MSLPAESKKNGSCCTRQSSLSQTWPFPNSSYHMLLAESMFDNPSPSRLVTSSCHSIIMTFLARHGLGRKGAKGAGAIAFQNLYLWGWVQPKDMLNLGTQAPPMRCTQSGELNTTHAYGAPGPSLSSPANVARSWQSRSPSGQRSHESPNFPFPGCNSLLEVRERKKEEGRFGARC